MTRLIGIACVKAPTPATTSVVRMKSVAYATDDNASEDSTASPVTRERRSGCATLDGIGLPRRSRFSEKEESSGMFREPPTGLADGLGLGLSLDARSASTRPKLLRVPRIPPVPREFWPERMLSYRLHPAVMVRRYVISGRVQGVGFPYFVQSVPVRESIRGWVRNLDDGRVETAASGEPDAMERFARA